MLSRIRGGLPGLLTSSFMRQWYAPDICLLRNHGRVQHLLFLFVWRQAINAHTAATAKSPSSLSHMASIPTALIDTLYSLRSRDFSCCIQQRCIVYTCDTVACDVCRKQHHSALTCLNDVNIAALLATVLHSVKPALRHVAYLTMTLLGR